MIRYTIPSMRHKILLTIPVYSESPIDLVITGKDYSKQNVVYFSREINDFKGQQLLHIPMPISPEKLLLSIYDKNRPSADAITTGQAKVTALQFNIPSPYNTPRDIEFYNLIAWFAERFRNLSPGEYYSDQKHYCISLHQKLFDEDGHELSTPSQVNRETGEIELSAEKIKNMSVYMMVMMLLHEFFHYRNKSTDEQKVDYYAADVYLAMGFPESEALYSFTNVFKPMKNPDGSVNEAHEEALIERTDNLYHYLYNRR